ncbi:hypothetical protein ACHAXR_006891 [Thalassiosira sp. AJA248-18]
MTRRPLSFTRIYSTLINPQRDHKALVCNAGNWASKGTTTRSVGSTTTSILASYSQFAPIQVRYSSNNNTRGNNDEHDLEEAMARALESEAPSAIARGSSNTNENNDQHEINKKGEECYMLATEALKNASHAKQKHEERLLQEQFDAMDKQKKRTQHREQQRQNERKGDPRLEKLNSKISSSKEGDVKDRAAGVAVVRTIVKQSNADLNVRIDKWNNSQPNNTNTTNKSSNNSKASKLSDEQHWQQIAQKNMEEAAFRYGHCLALTRLGNEALERAKDDSVSTSSVPFINLINRERCEEWTNESPIYLTTILELSAFIEGNSHTITNDGENSPSPWLLLALHLYEEAGAQGSAEGWYNLGHLLWDGPVTKKEKAMAAFHHAVELGDADAMYFIASQYLSYEENDTENDTSSLLSNTFIYYGPAFLSSLQASKASGPLPIPDQAELASLTNELQQHGYKLLHFAAHGHNHGPALHHLALLYNQHDDEEKFGHLLCKAAATGNPGSLFLRGHCYYFGTDGYDQDFPVALENFLLAAENGHVDAMVSAGSMLHQGVTSSEDGRSVIIARDQQRAFDLYQQAGELGSVEGWRNVVSCYATGEGVPKCLDTAKYIANTMLKEDKN